MPDRVRHRLAYLRYLASALRNSFGVFPRQCNACGHNGNFLAFGFSPRFDAMCPKCESMERHRFLLLMIERGQIELQAPILHFAPEKILSDRWRTDHEDYRTADLNYDSDLRLNLEKIELPDNSEQTIVCSHVLEHVDDTKALPELFRILKPGGTAILMVPVMEGWSSSYENSEVRTQREKLLHFNQIDHVRYYGRDFRDRILAAGFRLDEIATLPEDCIKYGLMRGERIFLARKD